MTLSEVMQELEALGSERAKKLYIGRGAKEPVFGVATGAMKPLLKKIKINQPLAEELYETGNYDAMYFAGMIADAEKMTKEDFNRWIKAAYFPMLSDFVVAVTLAESPLAMEIADEWLVSDNEYYVGAGYATYQWLLGYQADSFFDKEKISDMLDVAVKAIDNSTEHVRKGISEFIAAVGVSYIPLHDKAVEASKALDKYQKENSNTCSPFSAGLQIQKAVEKNRLGFKRKAVRC